MPVVAVPAVAAALLALLAVLLLWGARAFGQALANLIPRNIPLIGSALHNLILAGADVAEAAMSWIMADFIRPAIGWVLAPVYRLWDFIDSVYYFTARMAGSWSWLLNYGIPSVISKLENYAHALYSRALVYAHNLYLDAYHFAQQVYGAAKAYAYSLYLDAYHFAQQVYAAAKVYAYAYYKQAVSYSVALYQSGQAYARSILASSTAALTAELATLSKSISSELGVAERYADTKVSQAVVGVHDSISSAVAGVIQVVDVDAVKELGQAWSGVIDDVITLEGVIGTDLPDIGAAVRAIPRAVPLDLSAALSIVGAISLPMLRYMARCGVPNCRNLSSLGRDLAELAGAVEAGAFLALLIGLAADPIGTAHFLHDDVGPILEDAVSGARSVLGV